MAEKFLLLKARNVNWSLVSMGDWAGTEWFLFSDRSYQAVISYVPDRAEDFSCWEKGAKRGVEGTFSATEFAQLCTIMRERWLDPAINSEACDGEAWQIELYDPSGRTVKSTGKLGYIYLQPIERLTYILDRHISTSRLR